MRETFDSADMLPASTLVMAPMGLAPCGTGKTKKTC